MATAPFAWCRWRHRPPAGGSRQRSAEGGALTTRWRLDTSALLALRDDEGGAERVADLLQAAQSGESRCLVCFLSRMEVLTRVWKDEGERSAHLADAQLQSLPLAWVSCSDQLLERAAAIKACHPLSLADAWMAASAQLEGAVLVHKDPEFQSLAHIAQEWLA